MSDGDKPQAIKPKRAVVYGFVLAYTFGPILCAGAAEGIAHLLGCELNEANSHPCNCCGMEIGGMLYSMAMLAWLALATLPTGLLALVVLFVIDLTGKARQVLARKTKPPQDIVESK